MRILTTLFNTSITLIVLITTFACVRYPLYNAAWQGNNDEINRLVAEGINVNEKVVRDGWTPLMIAAAEGHLESVNILLNADADVNIRNKYGRTALMYAAGYGYTEIVKNLIEAKANVNDIDQKGLSPIIKSSKGGHIDTVIELLRAGADINTTTFDGYTPLMGASEQGHVRTVEKLIQLGANVNLRDRDGYDALQSAVYAGHAEVVRILLSNGGMANRKSKYGVLPLQMAISKNYNSVAKLLLSKGADPNITSHSPPLSKLLSKMPNEEKEDILKSIPETTEENKDVIQEMKSRGFEITSLMVAVQYGNVEMVEELLKNGADVHFKNNVWGTALSYSKTFGHKDIEKILIKAGALE